MPEQSNNHEGSPDKNKHDSNNMYAHLPGGFYREGFLAYDLESKKTLLQELEEINADIPKKDWSSRYSPKRLNQTYAEFIAEFEDAIKTCNLTVDYLSKIAPQFRKDWQTTSMEGFMEALWRVHEELIRRGYNHVDLTG